MSAIVKALQNLGEKVNGTRPQGGTKADVIQSIADGYTGGGSGGGGNDIEVYVDYLGISAYMQSDHQLITENPEFVSYKCADINGLFSKAKSGGIYNARALRIEHTDMEGLFVHAVTDYFTSIEDSVLNYYCVFAPSAVFEIEIDAQEVFVIALSSDFTICIGENGTVYMLDFNKRTTS